MKFILMSLISAFLLGAVGGGCVMAPREGISEKPSSGCRDMFLYSGCATQLVPESNSTPMHVSPHVVLPKGLPANEWNSILQLAARIPRIDRQVIDVIGWDESGPILAIRIQTRDFLVYFTRLPSEVWEVNVVRGEILLAPTCPSKHPRIPGSSGSQHPAR